MAVAWQVNPVAKAVLLSLGVFASSGYIHAQGAAVGVSGGSAYGNAASGISVYGSPQGADGSGAQMAERGSDEGRPLKFGSVMVYPSLEIKRGYDSNITQASSSQKKESSNYWSLKPAIKADYTSRGDKYALSYSATIDRFDRSSADDVENQNLRFSADNTFTARNAISWGLGLTDAYEARGSTDLSTPTDLEPNHYRTKSANAMYRYGASGAQGRLEFDAGLSQKRYLNNRANLRTADFDDHNFGVRFFWRIMPKTSAIFEIKQAETDYLVRAPRSLNSTSRTFLAGLTWDATAKTTGTVKIGRTKRDYSDSARGDFSGSSWEANINWKPLTYSAVDLSTSRAVSDAAATSLADYLTTTSYGIRWNHSWANHLSTKLGLTSLKTDYRGDSRRDKQITKSAGIFYGFRRWVSFGLELSHIDRDSNLALYDFDRRLTSAVVQLQF